MAAVTFIPTKPGEGKRRVQLSAGELQVLLGLVYDQVKNKRGADLEVLEPLGSLLVKLGRAYNRLGTSYTPGS